jgi:hypothetical protein
MHGAEAEAAEARQRARAVAVFEEAAARLAAAARRLDDLAGDVRHRVHGLHWTGQNADYFRRHAAYQAVRAGQNRDVIESLRVLVLRAAAEAGQPAAPSAPTQDRQPERREPTHHPKPKRDRDGVSGGGEG